ncbi:hypothetical protein F5Y12DRAFT_320159 [Xylaria sp. FL1777]|nr:hypothetical protein F5Y12DRAFT_320159 [Xylaria sp. FL1777]
MATPPKRSPPPDRIAAEDPDTAAARKELRQTAISEKPDLSAMATIDTNSDAVPSDDGPSAMGGSGKATTPELIARDDTAREQMASPKKKRAHDEVDEPKDAAAGANGDGDVSPIGPNGSASLDRSDRSEPEKKRPRDVSSESRSDPSITTTSPTSKDTTIASTEKSDKSTADKSKLDKSTSDKIVNNKDDEPLETKSNTTTASAFKSSGMSSFATQASPFLKAGAGQTLSSFASSSPTKSFVFSSSTKSIFDGGSSSSNGTTSPFGQIGSSTTFGSGTFGGFGGGLGGSRLTTFGKPGESLKSNKPAKPFGAPASEDEDEGEEEEDGNSSDNDKDDGENQDAEEDKAVETEDKKKTKLQRVAVDDGEADEATIIQVRARLYNLDKASSSWKERGAGNLKINVPMACVLTNNIGVPIPGSFDASTLEDAESKVVRLVMRQDSTHRVILNTAIIPTMEFQEKSSLKATYILFTAIEDEGAVSIQIKMNAVNAKSFLSEVESVQRQLQSV